jgi:hypothetical protein
MGLVYIDATFVPLNPGVGWRAEIINITGQNSWTRILIYSYRDWDDVGLGVDVCKTGRSTGTTCGYVIDKREFLSTPYRNLSYVIITNITVAPGDSGSPLYYHVKPSIRDLDTYILGHLSMGGNCMLAIVNGELTNLCPIFIFVSVKAVRNLFGLTICNSTRC